MGGALERFDSFDGQSVGADTGDVGSHGAEEVSQGLNMRFAGGVAQNGCALGKGGGADGVFRGGDGGLVEEDVGSAEFLGLDLQALFGVTDFRAQSRKDLQMGVQSAPADSVSANAGNGDLSGAGEDGTGQSDRSAESGGKIRMREGARGFGGLQGQGAANEIGVRFLGGKSQLREDALHEPDIFNLRDILEGDRLVGKTGSGHEGHGFVFIPLGFNFAGDGVSTLNDKLSSIGAGHIQKLPRPAPKGNPAGWTWIGLLLLLTGSETPKISKCG